MNDGAVWTLLIIGAYLLGSIPFALLLGRMCGVDIREHGSGNVGATNVMRVCGNRAGIACFGLDVAKGLVPTLASGLISGAIGASAVSGATAWLWLAVAFAAIFGHIFPVWLRFKGGKGVATGFGALLGVYPFLTGPALGGLVVWVISMRLLGRNVGLSSSIAAIAFPLLALAGAVVGSQTGLAPDAPALPFVGVATLLAALVVIRHRENLSRTFASWRAARGSEDGASREEPPRD